MEYGHTPCNLYIYFSKGLDTLSHDILQNILKYYGFVGTELKLLTSYLLNRKQYVKDKNYQSDLVDIQWFLRAQSLGHYYLVSILMIWSFQVTS